MKYPKKQFETLATSLQVMAQHFTNLREIHPSSLHFAVFQNHSEGQTHNRLVINEAGEVHRQHFVDSARLDGFSPLISADNSFEIYPSGCNDNHIETAVKAALKTIAAT